jgi:3-hydroxypropionyl-CoA synthetase (ADP-forming)
MAWEQSVMDRMDAIMHAAHTQGRHTLHEHEVYQLLRLAGMDVPQYVFVSDPKEVNEQMLSRFPGKDLMIKIVSRDLAHNQRYGGVKKVTIRDPLFVRFLLEQMREEVLSHFEQEQKPHIDGFLIVEFIRFTQALGNEIMIGMKEDASFGPVVTLSKGGDDAEFFAKYYDPANLFLAPVSYEDAQSFTQSLNIKHKYADMGHPEYLNMIAAGVNRISELGIAFSFLSGRKPSFYLKALDLNPIVFSKDGRFVAVDGYAEFIPANASDPVTALPDASNLKGFFHPKGIVVAGVSTKPEKFSMARNIVTLFAELYRDDVYCINPKGGEAVIQGRTYPLYKSIQEIPSPYDLVVYAAPGQYSLDFIRQVPPGKSVILISGIPAQMQYDEFVRGMGEARAPGVRVVGPNCMGIFRAPRDLEKGVNTLFIDEKRMHIPLGPKSNVALLTQSGAMGITSVERNQHAAIFSTIVSFGNKVDVDLPDLMAYFEKDSAVEVMALYLEGVGVGEGRRFYDLARRSKKPVIVYKSGRTEAGAKAAASHTASISGSYDVFKAACLQANCVLTEELDDFYHFTKAFAMLSGRKPCGLRVAGVVNAGLDATMGADLLRYLQPAEFSAETSLRIRELNTHGLVSAGTAFLDLTPMTDDVGYAAYMDAVLSDPGVDCLFVAIVPHVESLKTMADNYLDEDALGPMLVKTARHHQKPIVVSVNAGKHFSPLVQYLEENGLPVYGDIRSAIRSLDAFVEYWTGRQQE